MHQASVFPVRYALVIGCPGNYYRQAATLVQLRTKEKVLGPLPLVLDGRAGGTVIASWLVNFVRYGGSFMTKPGAALFPHIFQSGRIGPFSTVNRVKYAAC